MDMLRRTFTLAEAKALVPWLTEQFGETRRLAQELRALRLDAAERRELGAIEAGSTRVIVEPSPELLRRIAQVEDEIRSRIEEASLFGLEVRRVDGLVDFPTWMEGQLAFLCWRFGEKDIAFWHPTTTGFDGRRSLASQSGPAVN